MQSNRKVALFCCPKGVIFIAIYHCSIKIISRGKGKSAVAAAAYRSGEKLTNQYDGIVHDYTRKGGVTHTEILLPSHAPLEFSDRNTLWNSVEKIEKSKNSQLAREIEIAIPKELSDEQQIGLVRQYVNDNFVSVGMCADFAIHDKKDGNPHAHIMLTMRPLEKNGQWGAKSKKEYITDENGERVKLKNGNFKIKKVNTVDWNEQDKAELWRSAWAELANKYLEQNAISERIDHRSFARQGIDKIPSIHLGVAASQMERKGIETERGNINREISLTNKILAEIKAKINSLKKWIEKITAEKSAPVKAENIIELLNRRSGGGLTHWQKLRDLKAVSKAVVYLQNNNISTLPQLGEKISGLRDDYYTVRRNLKKTENRLSDLSEKLKQAEIYRKCRPVYKEYLSQKPKKKEDFYNAHTADLILYNAAVKFLKRNFNHGKLPVAEWKAQIEELTPKKKSLYADMYRLRDEVKTVEDIKKQLDAITQEQTRQKSREIETER